MNGQETFHSSSAGRVQPDSWEGRWRAAEQATEHKQWAEASKLWSALVHDASDVKERQRAGRRAAVASRKAGDLEQAREMLAYVVTELPNDRAMRRELGRLEAALDAQDVKNSYWSGRRRLFYLQVAKEISRRIASNANSIVDVGSGGTPILDWFPRVPVKASVDLRNPYESEDVESIKENFLDWHPGMTFNVGLCFQVMEHVPDARQFAQRMLELFDVSIVSVPYLWRESSTNSHVHDPVDEAKLQSWFGREPNFSHKIKELEGLERIICVYDRESEQAWSTVREAEFRYRWTLRGAESVLGKYGQAQMWQQSSDERKKSIDPLHAQLVKARKDAANARAQLESLRNRRSVRFALRVAERAGPLARVSRRRK